MAGGYPSSPSKRGQGYTADEVDSLAVQFGACAERQIANKESAVRLRAAERDLLQVAEAARDLMLKAVKGEKQYLAEVFGGSCTRFHRFRRVLDTVELSEMHEKDARWTDLQKAMEIIEEVLKQLGMFKPWKPSTKPPEAVSYKAAKKTYAPGEALSIAVDFSGGEPNCFRISPGLPEGLTLDPVTGTISGAVPPGVEVPERTYVIFASNEAGEVQVEVTFGVLPPAPSDVAFPDKPPTFFTCEKISYFLKADGGAATVWSVSPALPAGLELDERTGELRGTPLKGSPETEYEFTASNSGGKASLTLKLGVSVAPPMSLKYPSAEKTYPKGTVIYLEPEVVFKTVNEASAQPVRVKRRGSLILKPGEEVSAQVPLSERPLMTFTVEPPLPAGLELVEKTGFITGTPETHAPETTYKVTLENEGGKVSMDLVLEIRLLPPTALEYEDLPEKFFTGEPVTLTPTVEGLVSEWSVEPALPAGLHLDTAMGILQGVPSEVVPESSWTVTAKNAEGSTTTELTFSVVRAAPSGLEYPELSEAYPVLRSMSINPTVEGEVDEFSVSPALPEGIALDEKTGQISGIPKAVAAATTYEVTAKNETGSTKTALAFVVKVMPPAALTYPRVDDVYTVGEEIHLEPLVEGGATTWSVEPALPSGIEFNTTTGHIKGSPTETKLEQSYVVEASNEAGGTSVVLTFGITAPKPDGLTYPTAADDYVVGKEMTIEPSLECGVCASFSVSPDLPAGISLDSKTGVISGTPSAAVDQQTYKVSASNLAGSTDVELTFRCSDIPQPQEDSGTGVNQDFARMIEGITDIKDLCAEPSKGATLGDWMIWMVHRAWLNDTSLTEFNFSNMTMPLPHMEPRIAPKLMKAMGHNTVITSLLLAHSNLQKPQGHELAESLQKNSTLKILNIESNSLDSDAITACATALNANPGSKLEQWRFNNQQHLGNYFGRPVEQAVAELVEKKTHILKLGMAVQDQHWRLVIDRAILRNNDAARRRRKGSILMAEVEEVAAQDRALQKLSLTSPPSTAVWEVFEDDNVQFKVVRAFLGANKRMPSREQLQTFARGQGTSLAYSAVAPLVKDFQGRLLKAWVGLQVSCTDPYGTSSPGVLKNWTEKNDRWNLDVWPSEGVRFNFQSDKAPILEISEEVATWLKPRE